MIIKKSVLVQIDVPVVHNRQRKHNAVNLEDSAGASTF